jgi:F0F1-type ATP synthase membrane subunit b/b'
LKKTTQQEIEMLSQESVRQLREHVITLAVEIAREKIQQGMTPAVHSKLIDKSIEKFEELNEE